MSGYAAFPAHAVSVACSRYLTARDQRIAANQEVLVQRAMKRRFFRDRTRDEAITHLSGDLFSPFMLEAARGGRNAEKVECLFELANVTLRSGVHPHLVNLTAEEAGILGDYL